jgi:hypothetical protein
MPGGWRWHAGPVIAAVIVAVSPSLALGADGREPGHPSYGAMVVSGLVITGWLVVFALLTMSKDDR